MMDNNDPATATMPQGDVENAASSSIASPMNGDGGGGDNSTMAGDNFTIGDDDDSTLQPPPSEMMGGGGQGQHPYHHPTISTDLDDMDTIATTAERANDDGDDDDDFDDVEDGGPVHDQLPSPEEYKAKMKEGFISPTANTKITHTTPTTVIADEDEDYFHEKDITTVHDQLPSVDEYKSSINYSGPRKSRTGLYTFLILFLLTAIITAIAVPLALKEEKALDSNGSSSDDDDVDDDDSSSGSLPSVLSERRRLTIDYLVSIGMTDRENMESGTGTPHYMAVKWIADDDRFEMDIPPTDGTSVMAPHTRFTERFVLAVLYYAASGQYWKHDMKFLQPIDHCDWYQEFVTTSGSIVRYGITHCATLGSGFSDLMVHKIELPDNGLVGAITKEIAYLHRLTHLILPFNEGLSKDGSLEGLHTLAYITDLELQYCSFGGTVPSFFGNLRALTNLGLGSNFFEGELPSTFWSLSNLRILGIDNNYFKGRIESFGNLKKLENLYAEDNSLYGSITESMISGWTKMKVLDLSLNELGGSLPTNLFSLSNLEVLDLHSNEFSGPIPPITTANEQLTLVALHRNKFNSTIPSTINKLVNLAHLDVSQNNIVLPFPSTMSEMTNLRYLFVGQNSFQTQVIPGWVADLTKLRELSMKGSNLTGTIPSFLGGLSKLQLLDFDMNELTGTIPEEIGLLKGLDGIMLNRNKLTGSIPASFALLDDLDVLLLDGNSLNGTADVICKGSLGKNLTHFVSDCMGPNAEISCSCCHLCCHDSNVTCNNYDWHVNLDPTWEYDYTRVVYSFSKNLLPPTDGNDGKL